MPNKHKILKLLH